MTRNFPAIVATIGACALLGTGCDPEDPKVNRSPGSGAPELWIDDAPILSLEGPGGAESPFHQITSAVVLANGEFAIADQGTRIVILDPEGSLVRTLGRSGDGPGEFRRVAWVQAARGDSLLVFDPVLNRASLFSSEGLHGRTITLEPRGGAGRPPAILGVFEDGQLLGSEPLPAPPPEGGSGIIRPDMILSLHDKDGRYLDSLGVVPGNERAVAEGVLVGGLPLLRSTMIVVDAGTFYVATGERRVVESRDLGGVVVRTVGDGGEPEPVTREFIESAEVPEPLVPLLPTHPPAVGGVIADRHRRVWVGPYVPASRQEAVPWTVYGPDGEEVGEVRVPAGFRPLDVGRLQVIGIWKDHLGVEHVRVYAVDGPGPEGG